MLHQSMHATGAAFPAMMEPIKSRFGEVTVDTGKALHFPRGLLGMPGKSRFALASFPNPKMQQFMLLQSLDDAALSFIALPLEMKNAILAEADLKAACRELQIPMNRNWRCCSIVSVHRGAD